MTISESHPKAPHALTAARKRAAAPLKAVRRGRVAVARQVRPTAKAAESGARNAVGAVRTAPDSTLRWLSVASIGLGAGLFVSGRSRLAVTAGLIPAVVTTIVLRRRGASINPLATGLAAEPPILGA